MSTAVDNLSSPPPAEDAHGVQHLLRNVLTSWGGQAVAIVSGFVIPHLIDRRLGQATLGVWDFAWAVVSYFQFVALGVGSSINRYVAAHRARGDIAGLNRAMSSVAVVLFVMSSVVVALAVGCSLGLSGFAPETVGNRSEASWMIVLLGASLAVQLSSAVYSGVLTGCHRWDWHNATYVASSAVTFAGMLTVLACGAGIVWLAGIVLLNEVLARYARLFLARRACPALQIRYRAARWSVAREMLGFGGKNIIRDGSHVLLDQTVSVLIWSFLGPAVLAVYARPMGLIRNVVALVQKYANVLIPTASSLESAGELQQVKELAVQASRYGIFLCLPIHLALMIMGGQLIHVWMGAEYANNTLVALIALGSLFYLSYMPLAFILTGVNRHGRLGLAHLAMSILTILLVFGILRWFQAGILAVALALAIPRVLLNGIYLPVHACGRLGIPVRHYLKTVWTPPLASCLPFAACLGAARLLLPHSPFLALVAGGASGGLLLSVFYWRYVLPPPWRQRVLAWVSSRSRRRAAVGDDLPTPQDIPVQNP